jgi:hypothetical protein
MNARALALAVTAGALTVGAIVFAQPQGPSQPQTRQPGAAPDINALSTKLVDGLKATPGCLGVEQATTKTGKAVIFAWFEDKAAALAWYESPTHQGVMNSFFPGRPTEGEPMKDVPDDVPILTIASLKVTGQPLPGTNAPISEISIELYSPLPAGIRVNGGFAPEGLKVEGRKDITIDPDQPAPPKPGSR